MPSGLLILTLLVGWAAAATLTVGPCDRIMAAIGAMSFGGKTKEGGFACRCSEI